MLDDDTPDAALEAAIRTHIQAPRIGEAFDADYADTASALHRDLARARRRFYLQTGGDGS